MFRGSLNPKEWRTSQDTEEIAAILKPFDFPQGKIKKFPNKERFTSHYTQEFRNKSHNKVPVFSTTDTRMLSHTLDTHSPNHINQSPKYVDLTTRLQKQIFQNIEDHSRIERIQ